MVIFEILVNLDALSNLIILDPYCKIKYWVHIKVQVFTSYIKVFHFKVIKFEALGSSCYYLYLRLGFC